VLRRLLFAVLFCVAAWVVTTDRTPADPGVAGVKAASVAATAATPPTDTHPPEARWESLLPPGIGGGSSRSDEHQLQVHAADLPGVANRVPWPVVRRTDAEGHAARFRPSHLLHTPLLI
jgi:hypothetical protein